MDNTEQAKVNELDAAVEAWGSMERVYVQASARFSYSEFLNAPEPLPVVAAERLQWLADMISWMVIKHLCQIDSGQFARARQTRDQIGLMLNEMRTLLDKTKTTKEKQ